ncbi:MAG: MATE family efflux transporter [Methanobrevibacter sp.]|jgi:putative MATE family efflux protein|nr:MATE family efflux transporter [Candidatus Methanovirga procula]
MNNNKTTEGVELLLGDPKKAIWKLSLPTIIAMTITFSHHFIDGIWIAGLGKNAIAAIGFIMPIFQITIGLANGIGAGATAVISRYIGEDNKNQVDNTAFHVLLLIIIISIVIDIIAILFLKPIILFLGAGETADLAYQYTMIFLIGFIFVNFTTISCGILRGEGNVKKATYAMILGAILNMILDPILIYYFSFGMVGASLASILSFFIASLFIIKWFKKDTYVKFSYKSFKLDKKIIKRLLSVGLPVGAEYTIFSILTIVFNMIILTVSGINGIAIYSAGWRVFMLVTVPIMGVSASIVPVLAASYGGRKYENFNIILNYAIKLGTIIGFIILSIIFIFADQIAYIFAYTNQTSEFLEGISTFLRIGSFFIMCVPLGSIAASFFQGLGRGLDSLILTFIRELLLISIFAYIFAITLNFGIIGVWIGLVIGSMIGSLMSLAYSKLFIKSFLKSV